MTIAERAITLCKQYQKSWAPDGPEPAWCGAEALRRKGEPDFCPCGRWGRHTLEAARETQ